MKVLMLSTILKPEEEVVKRKKEITVKEWKDLRTWQQYWIKNFINQGHEVTALNILRNKVDITTEYDLCILLSGGPYFRRIMKYSTKHPIPVFLYFDDSWEHYNKELNYKEIFIKTRADLALIRCFDTLPWWRKDNLPVAWFPCAIDEDYFYPMDLKKEKDIFFSGRGRKKRLLYLNRLAQQYDTDFHVFLGGSRYSQRFPQLTEQIEAKCGAFKKYREGINKAKLGFECSKSKDLGARPFEIMGCKIACVAERTNGAMKLFEEGKEIILWNNWRDLNTKIEYYLKHEEEREWIAQNGYEKVKRKHLFKHRVKFVERLYEVIVNERDKD